MKTIPILLLRLEGPLQSWGERSKWDYRDTASFPSKSGIVGLIGCAMGLERDDPRLGELCSQIRIAVRADRPGELITDYHTVSADQILNAEGKKRSVGNTIVTHRAYLQDASFLAAITLADPTGDIARLKEIAHALEAPVWTMYLGRKSCVPSVPLIARLTEAYGSLEEALTKEPLAKRATAPIVAEIDSADGSGYLRSDVRIASATRGFESRRVTVIPIRIENKEEVDHVSLENLT